MRRAFTLIEIVVVAAIVALVATTASLVIDRTAKPAANTKTSTTLTGVAGDATYYALFEGDPRVSAIMEDSAGANMGAGKVTGTGRYAEGKKVTVKATANKGYVFRGWEVVPVSANGRDARSPS